VRKVLPLTLLLRCWEPFFPPAPQPFHAASEERKELVSPLEQLYMKALIIALFFLSDSLLGCSLSGLFLSSTTRKAESTCKVFLPYYLIPSLSLFLCPFYSYYGYDLSSFLFLESHPLRSMGFSCSLLFLYVQSLPFTTTGSSSVKASDVLLFVLPSQDCDDHPSFFVWAAYSCPLPPIFPGWMLDGTCSPLSFLFLGRHFLFPPTR